MTLAAIHKRVEESFFRWGWLLPVVLPLTELGGRGLYNTLAGLYGIWGLLSLWGRRQRLDRTTASLYLFVLLVFLLGIPGAVDPKEGLRIWLGFLAPSLALLLVPAALRESPAAFARLLDSAVLFGAIALVGLYGLLLYYGFGLSGQPFDPNLQLQEDNLPFLLPFFLGWIWWRGHDIRRYWRMAAAIILVLAYIVMAEGRAALVGLIVGLVVFSKLVLGWRWWWIGGLAAAVLLVAVTVNTEPFRKTELDSNRPLDAFTAGRTALWRQALAHPPAHAWVGVGLGNGRHVTEILGFQLNATKTQVHHLHNFLLEAWYETGILGVGALLALIGSVFWRLARRWNGLSFQDRQRAGVLLAAALAILGAALLSFSYTSRHFAYLFVCLGALNCLAGNSVEANAGTDNAVS
ncbi:MAG TPA: O-antigen ligase family protein [Candidatus Competibacter sp.]|nr:hypothetical protein [Candidatus Competibacteraceae bacterium]HRC73667.1 O-antigen ligase family protein [Candidatus Competibacter sp.]